MTAQLELLKEIWSHSPGRYVSLPYLADGKWNNGGMYAKEKELPTFPGGIAVDIYFSPLTYNTQQGGRRRDNISEAGVIYADLDGLPAMKNKYELPPASLIVASGTPLHQHWYWFLDEPVPIDEWELHAKGTTELLGSDPGGWDATQVLRVPGSLNHKTHPATQVSVLARSRDRYPITEFPVPRLGLARAVVSEDPAPTISRKAIRGTYDSYWPQLLVSEQLLLRGSEKAKDRSKVVWGMITRWLAAGIPPLAVFYLLVVAPFNKYPPERLWAQILKAEESSPAMPAAAA